jgi:hypothetical protein
VRAVWTGWTGRDGAGEASQADGTG